MASETCRVYWFPSVLMQYVSSVRSAKLKIICVKKEQKSAYLDTFAIQTSYIAYMVCSYSQGGGGQPASPRPPNETLMSVYGDAL